MPRKRGRNVSRRRSRRRTRSSSGIKKNLRIVFANLIVFAILFLISLTLLWVFKSPTLQSLFLIFTIGFGAISVAFLITLVVFLFLKLFSKK